MDAVGPNEQKRVENQNNYITRFIFRYVTYWWIRVWKMYAILLKSKLLLWEN